MIEPDKHFPRVFFEGLFAEENDFWVIAGSPINRNTYALQYPNFGPKRANIIDVCGRWTRKNTVPCVNNEIRDLLSLIINGEDIEWLFGREVNDGLILPSHRRFLVGGEYEPIDSGLFCGTTAEYLQILSKR